MDIDFGKYLAAVEREVSYVDVDGKKASEVVISREYSTTVEELWGAVTSADRIPCWFLPVRGDLKLGGRFQLEGNAGGTITSCERPSNFTLTWEFAGDVSWVEVRLSEGKEGGAGLTLTHTALLSEHWDTFGAGATGVGWEMALLGLSMHVTDPGQPKPDATEFALSSEGRALIADSSEGWGRASVAAGTDEEAARVAAARTTAFYTGEPFE